MFYPTQIPLYLKIALFLLIISLVAFLLFSQRARHIKKICKNSFMDGVVKRSNKEKAALRKKLVSMVLWDEKTANRLIEMERGRTPTAPETQLIRSAIERIQRDSM